MYQYYVSYSHMHLNKAGEFGFGGCSITRNVPFLTGDEIVLLGKEIENEFKVKNVVVLAVTPIRGI